MELTVLGNNGPWPEPGGACSGYLVTEGETRLLLDCGSGVLARLQEHLMPEDLTAVVATHLHYDHISDLLVMRYALEAARRRGVRLEPLPLYAPSEPRAVFESLWHKDLFQVEELHPGQDFEWGNLRVETLATEHPLPTAAVALTGAGSRLVYTSDTEWFPELVSFCRGADLLVCEANFRREDIRAGKGNHLSGEQAGQLAAEAGVKRLLLTHFLPGSDKDELLAEARPHFAAAELARRGESYAMES